MAAIKIKARGSKPEPKPEAKPKTKRSTARKGATAKPAAKATPAKRGRKPAAQPAAEEGQRRNKTGLAKTDPKAEAKLLKAVKAAGDRRRKAKIEHEESVNALYEVAREALEAGVSMAKVADASDISRQWLYKMGDFAGREGGNGGGSAPKPKAKPAAKQRPSTRKSTGTGSTRSRTTKRGTGTKKSTASKPRRSKVSIRS